MKVLKIDEKWSVEYDPDFNDKPMYWVRNGERHTRFSESNSVVALFYALLEAKRNETSDP